MKKLINNIAILLVFVLLGLTFQACEDQPDYGIEGNLPDKPEFTIEAVEGDPNSFVVTDLSEGNFSRVWSFAGGDPETSTSRTDTVFYNRMGEYEIILNVAGADGSGNAFNTQSVIVEADVAGCQFEMLTEDCTTQCWRLSGEPGGILVGPVPFSGEWFTSPDIVEEQADDLWCFNPDGSFEYFNNGATFSSCQGFVAIDDYPIPDNMTWQYTANAGLDGANTILIDGIFMGIEDTGPQYDIIEVTEDKMVMLTTITPCDGSPSPGFFTITFFKAL